MYESMEMSESVEDSSNCQYIPGECEMWQEMRLERDGQIMKSSECHIN